MKSRSLLGVVSGLFLMTQPLFAGLTWQQTEVHGMLQPGETAVRLTFKFTNTGETPLKIMKVHRCCGVWTEELTKTDYAPGESGEVHAWAYPRGMSHEMVRTLEVTSEDGVVTSLTVKAGVADYLTVKPDFLFWQVGEKLQPKTVEIEVEGTQHPVSSLQAKVAGHAFDAEVAVMDHGKNRYRLTVTPKSTAQAAQAVVTVEAPGSKTAVAQVKVMVR